MARYVRWFDELSLADVALVGGKNAALGELHREVRAAGVRVPDGFATTAEAWWRVLDAAGLRPRLADVLAGLDRSDVNDLARRGHAARELVRGAALPNDVWEEVRAAYARLCASHGRDADVAVRSSATAEDLPAASFAGQQESYLNVRGEAALREAVSRCLASLFTDRAIAYRVDQGFDHLTVALSVGIQTMVRSDLAASGVMFTLDTETGCRDVVLVTAAYGLGESVVQGVVEPDEFLVFKPALRAGFRPIVRRRVGAKQLRMVYAEGAAGVTTRALPVADEARARLCIDDDAVLELARAAVAVEDHYRAKLGHDQPLDLEWARDGRTGELFIVQARPETVQSRRRTDVLETWVLDAPPDARGEVLARGQSVGQKVGAGRARVVAAPDALGAFVPGEVLVAETTTPDWEPVMKLAAAIVTSRGGRTCHAAIVARELGIPAVVGAEGATRALADAGEVTVSCAGGDAGVVYRGRLAHHVERVDLAALPRPRTKVMLNVADPAQALALAQLPSDGVGLARMEFIINSAIRVHPMALVHPERVTDPATRAAIEKLTAGHADKGEYFVARLAEGVGLIAAAFFPRPVIVRLSDFKTNEYAKLVGGAAFEPAEENPMLGFRGASRYAHPAYAEGFALECRALRRVRSEMGLANVRVMVPFCRRIDEAERVLAEMAKHGLARGEDGLEVYVMCEIPSNVVSIDAFAARFDGFSIGSNDLTQLTLGVDRDSALVAFDFDERDPAVLALLKQAVEGARRNGRHCGICGQAPSDYPEIAEYLVRLGIGSLSLNPDTVVRTTLRVLEIERALALEHGPLPETD